MRSKNWVDRIFDNPGLDRVPLLPMPLIMALGVVIFINSTLSMFTDYESPWWLGLPWLLAFFLLLFRRAAHADKIAKAAQEHKPH